MHPKSHQKKKKVKTQDTNWVIYQYVSDINTEQGHLKLTQTSKNVAAERRGMTGRHSTEDGAQPPYT